MDNAQPAGSNSQKQHRDKRLYHGERQQFQGNHNSLRAVRRLDALAGLLTERLTSPVTAVALNPVTKKLIIGFNSPRNADLETYKKNLVGIVKERMVAIRAFFENGETDGISQLMIKLSTEAKITGEVHEYPISKADADVSKVYDALGTPGTPKELAEFVNDNQDYLVELLTIEGNTPEQAYTIYQQMRDEPGFCNQHPYFDERSVEYLFLNRATRQAILDDNFEVVVEPLVDGAVVHAEVAVANELLRSQVLYTGEERLMIPVGINKLCCARCSTFFSTLNKVMDGLYEAQNDEDRKKSMPPKFKVTGTSSVLYDNTASVLPRDLIRHATLKGAFQRSGLYRLISGPEDDERVRIEIPAEEDRVLKTIYHGDQRKGALDFVLSSMAATSPSRQQVKRCRNDRDGDGQKRKDLEKEITSLECKITDQKEKCQGYMVDVRHKEGIEKRAEQQLTNIVDILKRIIPLNKYYIDIGLIRGAKKAYLQIHPKSDTDALDALDALLVQIRDDQASGKPHKDLNINVRKIVEGAQKIPMLVQALAKKKSAREQQLVLEKRRDVYIAKMQVLLGYKAEPKTPARKNLLPFFSAWMEREQTSSPAAGSSAGSPAGSPAGVEASNTSVAGLDTPSPVPPSNRIWKGKAAAERQAQQAGSFDYRGGRRDDGSGAGPSNRG